MSLPQVMHLVARANDTRIECTKDTCPASESIYGYAPNLGASAFFIAIFSISCLVYIYQTIKYRRWMGFNIALTLGTALEAVGYGSRIMLSKDPFSDAGFKLNIVILTFTPALMSASIYLLLRQLCYTFGPQFSLLRPRLYTYVFITCDIISILLQAAGGAISAVAADDASGRDLLKTGENVMIAGLSFQVITLVVFAALAADFFVRVWKHRTQLPRSTVALRRSRKFRAFLAATVLSFTCILTRCAYRIAELQGGWGSSIMRDEDLFIGLESVMIAVASIIFNFFHPGFCYANPDGKDMEGTARSVRSQSSDAVLPTSEEAKRERQEV